MNSTCARSASAPWRATTSSGVTTVSGRDLDMRRPSLACTTPCDRNSGNGSRKSIRPASASTRVKKRAYSRCPVACSAPPAYRSTGNQRCTASRSKAKSSACGLAKRRKYHDEQTEPAMVSVSRCAGPPHCGQVVLTNSGILASGLRPSPRGSNAPVGSGGRRTGSCSSGTGTIPHTGQCTIGIGAPQ